MLTRLCCRCAVGGRRAAPKPDRPRRRVPDSPDAASASRCVCVGRNGFEPKSVHAPALLIAPHAAAGTETLFLARISPDSAFAIAKRLILSFVARNVNDSRAGCPYTCG